MARGFKNKFPRAKPVPLSLGWVNASSFLGGDFVPTHWKL